MCAPRFARDSAHPQVTYYAQAAGVLSHDFHFSFRKCCVAIVVLQLCIAIMFSKFFLQLCFASVCCKCVLQMCFAIGFYNRVLQLCVLHSRFAFLCFVMVFCNCVLQLCVLQLRFAIVCFAIVFCEDEPKKS